MSPTFPPPRPPIFTAVQCLIAKHTRATLSVSCADKMSAFMGVVSPSLVSGRNRVQRLIEWRWRYTDNYPIFRPLFTMGASNVCIKSSVHSELNGLHEQSVVSQILDAKYDPPHFIIPMQPNHFFVASSHCMSRWVMCNVEWPLWWFMFVAMRNVRIRFRHHRPYQLLLPRWLLSPLSAI